MAEPKTRDAILESARTRFGMPYRLDPPPDGINNLDCSLYVLKTLQDAGLPLPGVRTAEQIRQATLPISWDDVQPGDLLFFEKTYDAAGPAGPDGRIASHIGISLGAGTKRMYDANSARGTGETNIGTPYWQEHIFEARRVPGVVDAAPAPTPSAGDPWRYFTAEQIADAAGAPVAKVRANWPKLAEQLHHAGIGDRATQIAMIGTVAIETASTFEPVREAFWLDDAWRKANLRYYPFYGRGYIQLTWRENYATYGPKIAQLWQAGGWEPDFDLLANPDNALNPDISAAVAAIYFRDHGGENERRIPKAAAAGNWAEVRRLVQGGSAGLDRLVEIATALQAIPSPGDPVPAPEPGPTPPTRVQELLANIERDLAELKTLVA
jgi:hypothetical protein